MRADGATDIRQENAMSKVHKLPVPQFPSLADEFERMFPSVLRRSLMRGSTGADLYEADWSPAVNVKESATEYTITADLPGVEAKDIKVELEDGVLTLSGERCVEKKEEKEDFRRFERFEGSFMRRFVMPDAADPEKVTAKSANGVLTVKVPKAPAKQPRQIKVES